MNKKTSINMQKVNVEAIAIIGISVRTSNVDGQAAKDIPALWNQFNSNNIQSKIPNKTGMEIYAVYTNYEGDHLKPYDLILGCPVSSLDNIPEGMVGHQIPKADYQKFLSKGNLIEGAIIKTWLEIWDSNIKRAYTSDFEIYDERAMNPTDGEADIYIAI